MTRLVRVELTDAVVYPLIVSSQTNNDPTILARFGDYRIVATYNLLYNASLLVKADVGIALCLDSMIETDDETSELVFLSFVQDNKDPLQLIWKKQSDLTPIACTFLQLLKTEIEDNKNQ